MNSSGRVLPFRRPNSAKPTGSDEDEIALVQRAQAGEFQARAALVKRHLSRVVGLAHRLAPEQDSEDIAHDAFVRMLTSLASLKAPAAFSGWLSSIVVAEVRSRLRRVSVRRRLGLAPAKEEEMALAISTDASPQIRDSIIDLYRAVGALDPEERVAVLLQRVEGLELEEIAERMDISVATVKRRLTAANGKLMGASNE